MRPALIQQLLIPIEYKTSIIWSSKFQTLDIVLSKQGLSV